MSEPEVIVGIGGAAGDGTASAGNTLVLSMARQGIAAYSYNSYQSVIRGGHSWLRLRFSAKKPLTQGDQVDVQIALNQDSLDRHLQELQPGGVCLYNGAKFQPSYDPPAGVQLCELPVPDLAPESVKLPVMQNTVAVGAAVQLMGLGFETLASVFETTFAKKPAVVQQNVEAARNGYDYAAKNFQPCIGANHMGVRGMCATSGGGFALMTEAIGMAAMHETPAVIINVMRAGPSTGVPTKTEQADLNQAFGASQGDFERVVLAPISMGDCFVTPPVAFDVADKYQLPVLILADLLMCEGSETVATDVLDVDFPIDRGELITTADGSLQAPYLRYKDTPSGISPRAIPGLPGHLYVSGTDEHDEDGVLLSDVFTDPIRRKKMVDKRHRKISTILRDLPTPTLEGPADAETTLLGWGSTWGVIKEAAERLTADGVSVNHLQIKTIIPLHGDEIGAVVEKSQRLIIIENNRSGQFARHLRAETGIVAHGHIRKYDGEPFEPKHIVSAVNDIIGGQEIVDVLSTEPGWRTDHPTGTSGPWDGLQQVTRPGVPTKA
jgi:pyruvate/2-oxoacid:ferredoxin oxidoreductase alpha subunit